MCIKEFHRIMTEHTTLALATCVDSIPNVRIVHFIFMEQLDRIFFISFRNNQKIHEFAKNATIAFTTIPIKELEYVRGVGIVSQSPIPLQEITFDFIKKIPELKESFQYDWKELRLFEIHITSYSVTCDSENPSSSSN